MLFKENGNTAAFTVYVIVHKSSSADVLFLLYISTFQSILLYLIRVPQTLFCFKGSVSFHATVHNSCLAGCRMGIIKQLGFKKRYAQ